jgi:hypothetical protein
MTTFIARQFRDRAYRRGASAKPLPTSIARPLLIGMLALGLTGCVYLRLLEVKHQLNEFDRNFEVQVTDRLALQFRHPVLYGGDFLYLTELDPTRIEKVSSGTRWTVDFHKLDAHERVESPRRTLSFLMDFNAEEKLTGFAFSPLFLAMAPPEFLEASIRSLGKGRVDTGHRQLRVDPQDLPKIRAKLPTRAIIHGIFGKPFSRSRDSDGVRYVYRFMADVHPREQRAEARRLAEVRLLFQGESETLAQMQGKFVGLKLRIDYRKLQGLSTE